VAAGVDGVGGSEGALGREPERRLVRVFGVRRGG